MNSPSLAIDGRSIGDTAVLSLTGSLAGEALSKLEEEIQALEPSSKCRCLVLDLENLTYLDSQGLSLLVKVHRQLAERDAEMRILNANENLLRVFRVSNLINLFQFGPPPESQSASIREHREALWQSHAFTNQLIAALGEAVLGLDPEGNVLFANPAAEKMLGCEEADLLGHPLCEKIPMKDVLGRPVEIGRLARTNGSAKREPVQRLEVSIQGRDGQHEVEILATTIFQSGEKTGTVLGLHDLTSKRAAQAELKKLAIAVDQSAEMIVITGTDKTIQYVNPAFEKLTGFDREDAIGQTPDFLDNGDPEGGIFQKAQGVIGQGKVWTGRVTQKKKNGDLYEGEARISPRFDSNGNIVNYVAVMRDVSEEVRLERQLRQTQKFEAMAQLAGGMAHDFNNLLTTVMGNLGMARRRGPPELTTFLDNAEKACLRGASLVNQMLLYSRESRLEVVPLDLNLVVEEVVALARETIDRRIEIETGLQPDIPTVNADPSQIHQVLLNLILNARDAIEEQVRTALVPPRAVCRIAVETQTEVVPEDRRRDPSERKEGQYVLVTVTDNGTGMDPETLDRLFEPFFTTKGESGGTGLGLASVYGIVQSHGGWIDVESKRGEGSVFRVHLPVSPVRADRPKAAIADERIRGGSETILVVDDEDSIREVAKEVLEAYGYSTWIARNGEEALDFFRRRHGEVDLVILDLSMPKLSGQEAYCRMREIDPHVKVLFCSGYPETSLPEPPPGGVMAYMEKPYRATELVHRVRKTLDEDSRNQPQTP